MPRDDVRQRFEDNVLYYGELLNKLPAISAESQPHAVCSRCASIRLDHLNGKNTPEGEQYYRHSSSYFALVASTSRHCPMCLLMLQGLTSSAGAGSLTHAMTLFDHKETGRPITLRAVRRPEDKNEENAKEGDMIRAIEVRIETWWGSEERALLPVFALPGTEAATKWNAQVRVPLGEKEKWEKVEQWLGSQLGILAGKKMRLPTRLIDVGLSPLETDPVRVIETSPLATPPPTEPYRYIALSYRWGEGNRLLTTKSTYTQHQTSIEMDGIPKTIRDAIYATRRLGIRYLWVDALCIIQDDEQDWANEAARMGDIYMNALCTIAAHAADHADCGFLKEAMQREVVVACGGRQFVIENNGTVRAEDFGVGAREATPSIVDYANDMAVYEELVSKTAAQLEVEPEGASLGPADTTNSSDHTSINFTPGAFLVSKGTYARFHLDKTELSSRGWVMQERILSPRTIHFGKSGSMYFETRDKIEHIEDGEERGYRPFPGLRDALRVLDELQGEQDEAPPLSTIQGRLVPFKVHDKIGNKVTVMKSLDELVYRGWYELVAKYSGCLLTESKDKMVALSGIVRKCQQVNKDRYISGIWLHPDHFHICLLWLAVEKDPLVATTDTGAPSWSWASVLGKVQYAHGLVSMEREISHMKAKIRLKSVDVRPELDKAEIVEGPGILELSDVVMIDTAKVGLRFGHFRAGVPFHYHIRNFVELDKPTRMWDVKDKDGEIVGWASLDSHPGIPDEPFKPETVIDASAEGITCFKVTGHDNDSPQNMDRGYFVLFVVFDQVSNVWKRVGMGQITKRELFNDEDKTVIRLG